LIESHYNFLMQYSDHTGYTVCFTAAGAMLRLLIRRAHIPSCHSICARLQLTKAETRVTCVIIIIVIIITMALLSQAWNCPPAVFKRREISKSQERKKESRLHTFNIEQQKVTGKGIFLSNLMKKETI